VGEFPCETLRVRNRRVFAAAIGLIVGGLVGCTHDGDDSATGRSSTTATPLTTAVPSGSESTTAMSAFDLRSVDWGRVGYPIDCGSTSQGVGAEVLQTAYAQPAPNAEVAVVLIACRAGAGTPPRSIFVFDRAISATSAHLAQTLSQDAVTGPRRITGSVAASGSTVTARGDSYSSATIPQCCPEGKFTAHWAWSGNEYKATT
jgi:hypothetical protein